MFFVNPRFFLKNADNNKVLYDYFIYSSKLQIDQR